MLCLQHVLVLSSGERVCAHVCWCVQKSVWFSTATLAAAFSGRACVFGVHVVTVLKTSWAFRDCACVFVRLFVRRDSKSTSRILLLQRKTHCFDWTDELARSL